MNVRVKNHVKKTPTRRKTFVDGIDMNEMQEWCGDTHY